MEIAEISAAAPAKPSDWIKTPVANLVRYKPSGIYFARVRIKGKLYRHSLKTNTISVAKLRLRDFIKEKQDEVGDDSALLTGKMTVGHCVAIFRDRLAGQQNIKEGAKVYRRKCIDGLLRSWGKVSDKDSAEVREAKLQAVNELPITKISKDECLEWAKQFAASYSASVYNNTVGTLRMILDIAVEKGARATNPAKFITKKRITQRELHLPSPEQFEKFVAEIESAGAWCSRDCADLVRFLAYGGFRKTEAANVTWADITWPKNENDSGAIRVRVTKNGAPRTVPMISDMETLLRRLKAANPNSQPNDPIMKVRECQKAMDNAAEKVGMNRITHHDLRHLFATRCIETNVDIPTVSRWLGHRDGGALAMKTYGHLRDHHSASMARRVTFSSAPASNVISLSEQKTAHN